MASHRRRQDTDLDRLHVATAGPSLWRKLEQLAVLSPTDYAAITVIVDDALRHRLLELGTEILSHGTM